VQIALIFHLRRLACFSVLDRARENRRLPTPKEDLGGQRMSIQLDLHSYSHFSFDGFAEPSAMIEMAKPRKSHGLAITDHDTSCSVARFGQPAALNADGLPVEGCLIILRKLADKGRAQHEQYRWILLTEEERSIAASLRGRHQVLMDFLRILGLSEETDERESHALEAVVSNETRKALARLVRLVRELAAVVPMKPLPSRKKLPPQTTV
jgi:hypothetical protein